MRGSCRQGALGFECSRYTYIMIRTGHQAHSFVAAVRTPISRCEAGALAALRISAGSRWWLVLESQMSAVFRSNDPPTSLCRKAIVPSDTRTNRIADSRLPSVNGGNFRCIRTHDPFSPVCLASSIAQDPSEQRQRQGTVGLGTRAASDRPAVCRAGNGHRVRHRWIGMACPVTVDRFTPDTGSTEKPRRALPNWGANCRRCPRRRQGP
jgi:hypothetical protein